MEIAGHLEPEVFVFVILDCTLCKMIPTTAPFPSHRKFQTVTIFKLKGEGIESVEK